MSLPPRIRPTPKRETRRPRPRLRAAISQLQDLQNARPGTVSVLADIIDAAHDRLIRSKSRYAATLPIRRLAKAR